MKILLAEDDPVTRRLLEANLLEWGYEVLAVSDGDEGWKVLNQPEAPSLVISDWMMPRMDGLELCRKIREEGDKQYVYFILLTSKEKKEDVINGLEAGADDFVTKPFNQEELKYRIRIGQRIINLEHWILELANTDPLTNVLNRRAFMEKLEPEQARSQREKTPYSIILTDIDYFKNVNDTWGHQAGDKVLQRFSAELYSSLRAYDFIGRYGGEEFIICLPGADAARSKTAAERMRKQTEEINIPWEAGSETIHITASFGTASNDSTYEENIDSIIKRADQALYKAKDEGRNRVC